MHKPDFQPILEQNTNNLNYVALYQMDELMEKLKLLDYERGLLKEMKMKPLSRYYFARSINPGEQFFMFTSICAWLIRKTGREFEQPQEFHDPSTTIGNIIKIAQEMDISTDFPTNRLMQGAGFVCMYILDCLATQAIKVNSSHLARPEINSEEDVTVEILANENEIILEKLDEQTAMLSDDSDDDHNGGIIDLNFRSQALSNKPKDIDGFSSGINTMTDTENWRLELERALPQLKIVVKTDPRDWRAHWEQMKMLRENINSASDDTEIQLKKLQSDITFAMEKIDSREKHLNSELTNLIQQFKSTSIEHDQIRNLIKETTNEKNNFEQELSRVIHDYENVKIQMDQRGNTMSDGSPLINIKKAIGKIKEEIIEMELEIGVLKHTVDQDIIKQNAIYSEIGVPSSSVF